jgi:hypothetical protein
VALARATRSCAHGRVVLMANTLAVLMLGQSQASSVNDIVLAMLNVIQTVALAYLAADRHNTRRDEKLR